MPPEPETAAEAFARTGRDAVTYARQVARSAKARYERRRSENAELTKQVGRGKLAGAATEPTPNVLRNAAKRFRAANGMPVPAMPAATDLVPPQPEPAPRRTRVGEDDEDFSQSRIMIRGE
jgi:hypothetical protein